MISPKSGQRRQFRLVKDYLRLLIGALTEFHLYPLSPIGGEGEGEGEVNLFSALINEIISTPLIFTNP